MPMRHGSRRRFLAETIKGVAAAGALWPVFTAQAKLFQDPEKVAFYPTYGFRNEDDDWIIPVRAWVHEPRDAFTAAVTRAIKNIAVSMGEVTTDEITNLRERLADFLADSESRERIEIAFDLDPEQERFQIEDESGNSLQTDGNGRIDGVIRLADVKARKLSSNQAGAGAWLTFRAVSKEHTGLGRAQLVERIGSSVISDIDDTIKVTEISAGARVVVRNTFFRDFMVAPGMPERYARFAGAVFHYVSGGPWQLFDPLADFIAGAFPQGSIHMKTIPTDLLRLESWEDLIDVAGPDATENHKLHEIRTLLERFPQRSFTLVGDSGEHDPAIYQRVRSEFPRQVGEIVIRDVVGLRHTDPGALEGMSVIPAPTVVEGRSILDV